MVLTSGPDFLQFYNDASAQLIGDKHPAALGQDLRVTLAEAWSTLEPITFEVELPRAAPRTVPQAALGLAPAHPPLPLRARAP